MSFYEFLPEDIIDTKVATNPSYTVELNGDQVTGSIFLDKPFLNTALEERIRRGVSEREGGLQEKRGPFTASIDIVDAEKNATNKQLYESILQLYDHYSLIDSDYTPNVTGSETTRFRVITVPEIYYERGILTGAFTASDVDNVGAQRILYDNGRGGIYSGSLTGTLVGNIFYSEGLVVLKGGGLNDEAYTAAPTLKLPLTGSGIDHLSNVLTINNVGVTASFVYEAKNANASTWTATVGDNLTAAGAGAILTQSVPFVSDTDRSIIPSGTYYQPASTDSGDIDLGDVAFEIVFKYSDAVQIIADKRTAVASNIPGWVIWCNSTGNVLNFRLGDADTTVDISSDPLVDGVWYHAICFMRRGQFGQIYVNGKSSGAAVSLAGVTTSSATTGNMTVGSADAGAFPFTQNLAYVAMWQYNSWMETHLQEDLARERFQKVCGIYPSIANGTALVASMSRNNVSGSYFGVSGTLFNVGPDWPRLVQRADASGTLVAGYLSELTKDNTCLYSQGFDDATWTKTNATVSASYGEAPDLTFSGLSLNEDATAAVAHYIEQATVAIVASQEYAYSVYAKSISRDWLWIQSNTSPNAFAYFDLSNGVVGTENNCIGKIESMRDGWYRCTILFTTTATTNTNLFIGVGEADNDTTFNGLDTPSLEIWGAQFEQSEYSTTYIPTVATSETREADVLLFSGSANLGSIGTNAQGTITCDFLLPSASIDTFPFATEMYKSSDTSERIFIRKDSSNQINAQVQADPGDDGSSTIFFIDYHDNVKHSTEMYWNQDQLQIKVDSDESTIDSTVDPPTELDTIAIGHNQTNVQQWGGVISNLAYYSTSVISGTNDFGEVSPTNFKWRCNFKGVHDIPVKIMRCRAPAGQLNASTNESFFFIPTESGSDFRNEKVKVLSSSLTYITKVGIYNDRYELVAVANLAQPIRKEEQQDLQFRIRMDW